VEKINQGGELACEGSTIEYAKERSTERNGTAPAGAEKTRKRTRKYSLKCCKHAGSGKTKNRAEHKRGGFNIEIDTLGRAREIQGHTHQRG